MNASNRHFILHAIRDSIRDVDADIVLLQEIHGEHDSQQKFIHNWPDNNQLEYLADDHWPYHAYGKNAIYRRGHHGNAILSKYPLTEWENVNVSMSPRASRSLLHAVIEIPDLQQRLHVICVHFGLFNFEREKQLARLVERIVAEIPSHEPLIIAGDFNDWRGRAATHLHMGLGVSEVFHKNAGKVARTFPAWLPMLCMDRIYSRGLEFANGEPLHGAPWRQLSDHIPLLAEFNLSPARVP